MTDNDIDAVEAMRRHADDFESVSRQFEWGDDSASPVAAHNDANIRLFDIADGLRTLAHAFEVTGNDRVARDLYIYARQLVAIHDVCQRAVGRLVGEQLRDAQQGSINLLRAALAGIEIVNRQYNAS